MLGALLCSQLLFEEDLAGTGIFALGFWGRGEGSVELNIFSGLEVSEMERGRGRGAERWVDCCN